MIEEYWRNRATLPDPVVDSSVLAKVYIETNPSHHAGVEGSHNLRQLGWYTKTLQPSTQSLSRDRIMRLAKDNEQYKIRCAVFVYLLCDLQ